MDEMLASEGHRVSVYNCSEEALADFKKSPDQYDLVITDQTMPGILGGELTAEIKAITPSLPIILCTGYSAFDIEHLAGEYEDIFVMKKPIDRQQLVSLINSFESTLMPIS
ncbi:multi-sensor hybrid histidine kinase [gamma proteobacterium IMCC2047]|nr:multi-sensor hybrid histidine kinase [gamma proteobacterium IMCC2047]